MTRFQSGQIWLVDFDPSFGHEYKKIRPAIIIQCTKYISSEHLLTVIPVSSQIHKQTELDVSLIKSSRNRLLTNSLVKIKQISSFDKRRFKKFIGIVDDEMMGRVQENIMKYLFENIATL